MLPKYNVFPKHNGEIGTGYLFYSKGRKKEERDNIAQASPTSSKANFLRLKNNLWFHALSSRPNMVVASHPQTLIKLGGVLPMRLY